MFLRNIQESDYVPIISVINDWWGGRPMADMLPRLFFQHFQDTSFLLEKDGEMIGFLVGFESSSQKGNSYIHFVGIHPEHRKSGYAKQLYNQFFKQMKERGCQRVNCITSPMNKGSISFHRKMGFYIQQGDATVEGISVFHNYDGKGNDRVVFQKDL